MGNNLREKEASLSLESVSANFAHDISTPLTTAQINITLLLEHVDLLTQVLSSDEAENIPHHIKLAIQRSPKLIQQNLGSIQESLKSYNSYLSSLHGEDDTSTLSQKENSNVSHDKKLKILMVDDEDIHHDIGEAILGKLHDLHHEMGGITAIELCKTKKFDVILMDMQMPHLAGPQTVEQLKRIVPKSTKIVGLTSMPIQSRKAELIDIGFHGFLGKPLTISAFNNIVESLEY